MVADLHCLRFPIRRACPASEDEDEDMLPPATMKMEAFVREDYNEVATMATALDASKAEDDDKWT
jgi:hypothetical protein